MKEKHIGKILRDKDGYYLQTFGVERSVGSLFEDFEGKMVTITIDEFQEDKSESIAEIYLKKLTTPCLS